MYMMMLIAASVKVLKYNTVTKWQFCFISNVYDDDNALCVSNTPVTSNNTLPTKVPRTQVYTIMVYDGDVFIN